MTKLRGMTWDHPRGRQPLEALASSFVASDGPVEITWAARSLQAFADVPLEQLASTYDLLVIDHPHIPLIAETGVLAPLDDELHANELEELALRSVGSSHASYRHDGRQWALAIDAAAQVSAYRPDLIEKPPVNWDEVFDLAREGRVLWPAKPVDAMSSFLTLLGSRGLTIGSDDGFVDRNEAADVLEMLRRLASFVPRDCLGENPIETAERLVEGDRWCYSPLLFGYVNYTRPGFRRHRLAYRDIPRVPAGPIGSCLGGAGIAVSARSAHRATAIEVAYWLASGPVQKGPYVENGGQPAHADAWEDEAANDATLDFFRGTRATLEGATVRPRRSGWMAYQDVVGDVVHAALTGETGVVESLDELERGWFAVLSAGEGR